MTIRRGKIAAEFRTQGALYRRAVQRVSSRAESEKVEGWRARREIGVFPLQSRRLKA